MCLEGESENFCLDSVLRAFADERRRAVVRHLRGSPDGVASYDELVDYVSAHCSTEEDQEQLKSRLHHVSLPALAEAGIIDHDARSETVRYQPIHTIDSLADALDEIEGHGMA